jgi:PKD domain/FG-GAP repeat
MLFYAGSDNLVASNLIGTESTGDVALGNVFDPAVDDGGAGVDVPYSPDTTVGEPGGRNVISGNGLGTVNGMNVNFYNSTGSVVQSNYIGTDITGTVALSTETYYGIGIQFSSGTIGGLTATPGSGLGNVISGNAIGIWYSGDTVPDAVVIEGNIIGADAAGGQALPNRDAGIDLEDASIVTIGGTAAGAGNLISGNDVPGSGGQIILSGSTNDLIEGNLIGTDITGLAALAGTGNQYGTGVSLVAGATDNTIGGTVAAARNIISGNAEGVMIEDGDPTGTVVAENLIGTDIKGTSSVPNLTGGIIITGGSGTTIGGVVGLALNVISGNEGDGVDIDSDSASTLVEGNFIGTDQTGTEPLPNTGDGVSVDDASSVTIGATMQSAGNVISSNAQSGVSITGTTTTGVLILGNRIGTDYTGALALGNASFGVLVSGTPGGTIGGTAPGYRNIISANTSGGIGLYAGTTGALVQGNLIGTDITASVPLGNGNGIQIDGGSFNNTIGGNGSGAGNTIAFSTGIGVDVDATAGTGNEIRLNSIFSNTGLGIDLGGNGVTLNNSVGHIGPNDYQNFPVITDVVSAGGTTTLTGTLNSTLDTAFELDFYTLSSMNKSGYGEGRYVLGSASVTTDGTGNVSFTLGFPTPAGGARFVTATATDPSGNTSEFSQEYGVDTPPTAVIGFTSITVNAGASIPFDGLGSTDPSGLPLAYFWTFGDGATATGPDPMHAYAAPGTDTVTLTVNDGFGGINTAQATVTVNDVAPVFTPDSFTPPISYTTPSPGDGFGESVASNYGNVAIGAPFQNGTGAVYLYDGVPTDNGVSSTYDYGALIHTFTDPNPEPGDEFGASLAVVGNELLIGAPGSSISGTGNGVVYVFDVDVDSTTFNVDTPTFGDLLATIVIPDPDGLIDAHFGAAVGATNTNIVIGAPGEDGGTGEVYEFEGDNTQTNFGDLLLEMNNPDAQARSGFGAAVAGIGNNVIVGAPSEIPRARAPGRSTCSTARPGRRRHSSSATRRRSSRLPVWCCRRPASSRGARSTSAAQSRAPAGATPTRS